jgi:hypothetical protein
VIDAHLQNNDSIVFSLRSVSNAGEQADANAASGKLGLTQSVPKVALGPTVIPGDLRSIQVATAAAAATAAKMQAILTARRRIASSTAPR